MIQLEGVRVGGACIEPKSVYRVSLEYSAHTLGGWHCDAGTWSSILDQHKRSDNCIVSVRVCAWYVCVCAHTTYVHAWMSMYVCVQPCVKYACEYCLDFQSMHVEIRSGDIDTGNSGMYTQACAYVSTSRHLDIRAGDNDTISNYGLHT